MEVKIKKNIKLQIQEGNKPFTIEEEQQISTHELRNESFGNWLEGDDFKQEISARELKNESFGNWLED